MQTPLVDNKSILTATSGFLGEGFTHTINPYLGCSFAGSLCGLYCYAQHNHWITKGRPWGLYGAKASASDAYRRDYDRLKHPRRGEARPLKIFMSSSTDPYVPQEKTLELTRSLLESMIDRPPDALVLQTRSVLVTRDLELLCRLADRTALRLSVTIETDQEQIPGLPKQAASPQARIQTLRQFREAGAPTQATVSPLLPLADESGFARALGEAADRVILDHYLLGDGSPRGLRTKRTRLPALLEENGYGDWNMLERFWEVAQEFRRVLGEDRVLISKAGFNAV